MYKASSIITNPAGLHARPAQKLVELCATFKSTITIVTPTKKLDPTSIFNLMMGAVKQGTALEVRAEGEDEIQAVDAIIAFLANLTD